VVGHPICQALPFNEVDRNQPGLQVARLVSAAEIDPRAKSITSSTDQSAIPIDIVLGDELSASPSAAVKADFERMRNWEFSAARATRMARLFIRAFAFQPGRLAAAGFAEYHPVTGNDNS
jgi:hypothetical protein